MLQSMGSQKVGHLTDGTVVKNLPTNAGVEGLIPGPEDALEREMATHSSILAWKTPWTEEPGRLQSMQLRKS